MGREEVLANVLEWVRFAIESYYAMNMEKVDKDRLMHHRFPEVLWANLENLSSGRRSCRCAIVVTGMLFGRDAVIA